MLYYFCSGHDQHDDSFDQIDQHSYVAHNLTLSSFLPSRMIHSNNNSSTDSDNNSENTAASRRSEIVVFESLLVLRALLLPRNCFLVPSMTNKRRRLKIALRRCILGIYDDVLIVGIHVVGVRCQRRPVFVPGFVCGCRYVCDYGG